MKTIISDYFYGTKNELRGSIVLFVLILFISIVRYFGFESTQNLATDTGDFQEKADIIVSATSSDIREASNTQKERQITSEFYFNPNTATAGDFERLGLSVRTAKSIINYRNKGGQFRKVEDFKKIYTLSEADFERLKPFIDIPKVENALAQEGDEGANADAKPTKEDGKKRIEKSTEVMIEVNEATVEDFQQLKGIGEGYAKRIVSYRSKLGGFVTITQVQEVYGLPKETYEVIEKQLTVKAAAIQKLSINTATYEDLVQHPYIDSKRANAIVKFRKQHGAFASVDDLGKIYAIPAATLKRIKPYLKL